MSEVIDAKIEDISYKLTLEGGIAYDYYKSGKWVEEYNIRFLMKSVRPESIFFDLGANTGIFSIPVAIRERKAKIYAFEPCSQTFQLLQKNIQLNDLDNIFLYQIAFSDYIGKGILKINDSLKDALNTLGEPSHPGCKVIAEEEVLVTTLDKFILDKHLPKIDLMKVDIEGAELSAFRGAKSLLQSPVAPIILFESQEITTKGFHYHPKQVEELLRSYGYIFFMPKVRVYDTIIASKSNTLEQPE